MKFLVLALCVCAASAASFGSASSSSFGGYKKFNRGYQNPAAAPAVYAANAAATVAAAPVVAAKTVVAAAAPVYTPVAQAAAATYSAAKQVGNKPYSADGEATIVRSDSEVSSDGYRYRYETGNGISAEAVGTYKQVGDASVVVSQGSYRYLSPEGVPVYVTYTADENGYQPQSDLLPVGPEIPEAIARSLVYIAAHPYSETKKY